MWDNGHMKQLIEACQNAKHIMFITGAGISAASGLPTYRGKNGIYTNSIIPASLILSKTAFKWFPNLVWRYLKRGYRNAEPNLAHNSIAVLDLLVDRITVVTQNVDGLHRKAGSHEVIELHGRADVLKCTKCGKTKDVELGPLPRCECGGIMRFPVVLFGENLPKDEVGRYFSAIKDFPDVIIAVGTSGNFEYISLPIESGKRRGAFTAVIDPEADNFASDLWIKGRAEEILPKIVDNLKAC